MSRGPGPPARVVSVWGTTTTVAVSGEIDIANAAQLQDYLTGCLAGGSADITLDLQDLTFIGASGLSVLADITSLAESRGKRLSLQRTPSSVQKVIEIAGLASVIHITDAASGREQP